MKRERLQLMPPYLFVVSVFAIFIVEEVDALTSRSVSIPLKVQYNDRNAALLESAFRDVVESSDFLVQSKKESNVCFCPAFGDDVSVKFKPTATTTNSDISSLGTQQSSLSATTPIAEITNKNDDLMIMLTVEKLKSKDDFGWICTKFYECKDYFHDMLEFESVRNVVVNHFNSRPAHPGYDAATARNNQVMNNLFAEHTKSSSNAPVPHSDKNAILQDLETNGYTVIDTNLKTTADIHQRLSKFLIETTGQGSKVRTDTVHFLNKDEADSCGLSKHFELLMGIASYLNENMSFQESPHLPILPGTKRRPLTIPSSIQLAEYGRDDFYKAHSDNSLTGEFTDNQIRIRSNYRHYTCILYCNDNWTLKNDGGALRIYPGSSQMLKPDDALESCNFVDVCPSNGRLIIFDSCLVHSVEKVTSDESKKVRRALTLWINRPNDSGVPGEVYY